MKRAARTLALAFIAVFACAWACTNDYDEFAYTPADSEPGTNGNTGPGSGGPGGPGGPSATGAGGSTSSGASSTSGGGAP